ncbi:MAG: thioredoxin fold domain-containing protein [Candidatus Latescibacterota bacterium]
MKLPVVFTVFVAGLALMFYGFSNTCDGQQKNAKGTTSVKSTANTKTDGIFTDDFNTAIAIAKKEKKPVFIDFYTEWCGWCKKMDKETYTDPGIQKQIKDGWVAMKIDAENTSQKGTFDGKSMTYSEIGRYFKVSGYPSFLFIDKDGKPVTVVPGYFQKKDFSLVLKYFKEELYTKKVPLDRYIEKNK